MTKRQTWIEFYLDLAKLVSTRSKDKSTKVGACITKGKKLVNIGYNGFAANVKDTLLRLNTREIKLKLTLHAELNAILTAKQDLTGCTLYCTHVPCAQCASIIAQTGIERVICYTPDPEFLERWKEDIDLTMEVFKEAEVALILK